MKLISLPGLVLIILWIIGCSDKQIMPEKQQFPEYYFPLEIGYYSVYEVEKISFSPVEPPDTIHYRLKQVVADSFPNQHDGYTFKLKRFRQSGPGGEWNIDSVWTARLTDNRLVIKENNTAYIKLAGFLKAGKAWDGHALNNKGENLYKVKKTEEIFDKELKTENDTLLNNTIGILQRESKDTLLNRVKAFEIYKKNVGLVYKEYVNLHYCSKESCFGQGIIESGTILNQILIENGKID